MPFAYTFRADDLETVANQDKDLLENRDRELELYLNQPQLSIARVATQVYLSASTAAISFDTEYTDTAGLFAPTSTNIIIPGGAGGLYAVAWTVTWDVAGTDKRADLYINADNVYPSASDAGTKIIYHANIMVIPGDVVTLSCTNTAVVTRNATATLMMTRLMA